MVRLRMVLLGKFGVLNAVMLRPRVPDSSARASDVPIVGANRSVRCNLLKFNKLSVAGA